MQITIKAFNTKKCISKLPLMSCLFSLVPIQGENDKSYGTDFVFDDHSKELIVGEIFVRVYNEQPMFPLEVR